MRSTSLWIIEKERSRRDFSCYSIRCFLKLRFHSIHCQKKETGTVKVANGTDKFWTTNVILWTPTSPDSDYRYNDTHVLSKFTTVKFCQSALTCNHRIVLFDEQPKWLVHCQTAWISFFVHYLNLTVCFDNISKYDCAAFCFPCCHWEVLSNQTSYCCSSFLRFILNFRLILLIPVVDFYRQTDSRQKMNEASDALAEIDAFIIWLIDLIWNLWQFLAKLVRS